MKKLIVSVLLALSIGLPIAAAQETPTPDFATVEPTATITPTPVIVQPPPPNPIPDDEPGELPVTTPETLLGQLYSLLKDATFMVWAAAGVIVIVGLIKVLLSAANIPLEGNTAIAVTLVVQVLIWLGYAIANYFQQGEAFKTWYLSLVDVARSLLPLFGAIFLGHVGFQAAHKRGVPILGYAVSKPAKTVSNTYRGDDRVA